MALELLNTLYVTLDNAYLHLQNETIRVEQDGKLLKSIPLHHLGAIVIFGNVLMSPALLARCAEDGRSVVWLDMQGRYRARLEGKTTGNVLLRRVNMNIFSNTFGNTLTHPPLVPPRRPAQASVLPKAAPAPRTPRQSMFGTARSVVSPPSLRCVGFRVYVTKAPVRDASCFRFLFLLVTLNMLPNQLYNTRRRSRRRYSIVSYPQVLIPEISYWTRSSEPAQPVS